MANLSPYRTTPTQIVVHCRIPGNWWTRFKRKWALFWLGRWRKRFRRCNCGSAVGRLDLFCIKCFHKKSIEAKAREREARIEEMAEAFRRARNS